MKYARISKIKFGHKIKNSHLVTVVIIRQRPRKPEVKQPSCWSSDQIEANEIIFSSADPARGHCGGVVFICAGVKPCSGHGRIFSVASPRKKTSNNCSFKKTMKYDREVESAGVCECLVKFDPLLQRRRTLLSCSRRQPLL